MNFVRRLFGMQGPGLESTKRDGGGLGAPTVLGRQLEDVLSPGMCVPPPLSLLFEWIENQGFFYDEAGKRVGLLYKPGPGQQLGTGIELAALGRESLNERFGTDDPLVLDRLCVIASTGSDGSSAALWLDDQGGQRFVHLGSGSGSTLVCTLADNALDFLRLIAIGYEELCWDDQFAEPPEDGPLNVRYRRWVETTFGVTIPSVALEVVRHPAHMGDEASEDSFCRWVASVVR